LFKEALLKSHATFKFVISSVSIQQIYTQPYGSWEGYSAERSEILNFIRDNHIKNVIFLTTDLHLNLMNEVSIDRTPVAYEFITGPIAQFTDRQKILNAFGTTNGPKAVEAQEQILTKFVGADCLDVLSYGSVQVDPINGKAIVSQDENGRTIHDGMHKNV
jgi:phosphodiesterase/alkaline phosphatase D-like protein